MEETKGLFKFIGLFVFLLFSSRIIKLVLGLFGIIYTPDNLFLYSIIDLTSTAIVTIVAIILYRRSLGQDFKEIIKDKSEIPTFIATVIAAYVGVIVIELLCGEMIAVISRLFNITYQEAHNQEMAESIIHASPIIMAFSAILFAPLQEELIFRCGIKNTIKNKGVFIAVSGLFFGLLHITGNYILLALLLISGYIISKIIESKNKNKILLSVITIVVAILLFFIAMILIYHGLGNYFNTIKISEILNGITYVALGMYLAGIYAYTDNIYYSIFTHLLVNGVATTLMLLK